MTSQNDNSVEEDQSGAVMRRAKGEFVRGISQFRSAIGDADFPPEANRYHLFVAFNCPWCHRVTLARNLLGLQTSITMDVTFPNRTGQDDPKGPSHWQFAPQLSASLTGAPLPECTLETATGRSFGLVSDIYAAEHSKERSVPILYDKQTHRIVSNESADIIRMLGQWAQLLGSNMSNTKRPDLYPADNRIRAQIDTLNESIYGAINNGAYKAGFSSDQAVYESAFKVYFDTLLALDNLLGDGRTFLTGNTLTEADLRLFPTLYRHDPVYYLRMKLNAAKILDYPHLWRWLCRMYATPGVASSNSLIHCRQGYFGRSWNNVIPLGPLHPMPYPQAYEHPELAR